MDTRRKARRVLKSPWKERHSRGSSAKVAKYSEHLTPSNTLKYHTQSTSFHLSSIYNTRKPHLFPSFSMNFSVHHKIFRVFSCPEHSGSESGVDMDQESCGSSTEEVESPRSVVVMVAAADRKSGGGAEKVRAHSQVLRIRAEDLHLGDDIGEGKLNKLGFRDFVIYSRPILPASPLGGKA